MEGKHMLWAVLIVVVLLSFTGKTDFLGATETGEWDTTLDGLIDTLQSMLNSIFELIKANPLMSVLLIAAGFFLFFSKR